MYMLVVLIFVTTAYQHNIARASDSCGPPPVNPNTVPVNDSYRLNSSIRIQCVDGYVRKVGTSNQIRCIKENDKATWKWSLTLQCIPDPKKKTKETPKTFTTETTETKTPTISGPSTAATGFITLTTTTNQVITTTPTTTNLPTLKSTTKEAESITTANEITSSSTSSSISSRQNMSTTSHYTTTTEINKSVKSTAKGLSGEFEHISGKQISAISVVIGIIILCLVATVLFLWRRSKRSEYTNVIILQDTNLDAGVSYIPVSVIAPQQNNETSRDSDQPQTGSIRD